ncbi:ATP-binding protein [Rhodoplanes sp. TEM]|uniref:histidine kinase n=1 Tax=Rhodoplanes tepidamans TaxID=200616 RepID=A0ABT5JBD0_RHOTP|nr:MULTISPECIES: ATP-binding protein [Rhodoplanes]MDC7786991.1 ATP-binding protein [Rhodoplanes tepidamans]MDC7986999.1 ATP-binding protein [Rhodoplanes sp. TEM]MDQ0354284.1 two-component system sensor histidine kinase HupT/HoxJ [Rhodoplanes tepidamans]
MGTDGRRLPPPAAPRSRPHPIEAQRPKNLVAHMARDGTITLDGDHERVWIDVIDKIDEVYSDLLRYESDLERKNTALEEAQAFIASVLASVSDILVVVDERAAIVQVNAAFERLVGEPEAALIGRSLLDLVEPPDRRPLADALARGAGTGEVEVRFRTTAGSSDLMAIAASVRRGRNARRAGAVLTGRPIGELRRAYMALDNAHRDLKDAQRTLIEQEKMASIGRLVAGVAHELNNPISFVYGNLHALARYRDTIVRYLDALHATPQPPDAGRLRRELKIDAILADLAPLLDGTLEGAVRISEIVRNLRRLSFTSPRERHPVDLEATVRTAAQLAQRAKAGAARVTLDLAAGVCAVGDEGKIHQVVVNLVDNALDAVAAVADPEVVVTLAAEGGDAVITIADNGPGIEPAIADKVFEPFFTTKPVGKGTGLGLWISYSIVTEHGGSLSLGGRERGGACVTVRLPACTDAVSA